MVGDGVQPSPFRPGPAAAKSVVMAEIPDTCAVTRARIALPDLAATGRLGAAIARGLGCGDAVALWGDLGAGKTTLVKGIAQCIGANAEDVTSPAFTLVHEYQGTKLKVYHLDLYHLEKDEELLSLGIEEMEADPNALVLVEWGEKFPSLLQRARGQVVIQPGDEPDERWFFVQML